MMSTRKPSNPRGSKLMVAHSKEIFISQLGPNGKPQLKTQCPFCKGWFSNMRIHILSKKALKSHRTNEVKC
jgi:hypothetical protein